MKLTASVLAVERKRRWLVKLILALPPAGFLFGFYFIARQFKALFSNFGAQLGAPTAFVFSHLFMSSIFFGLIGYCVLLAYFFDVIFNRTLTTKIYFGVCAISWLALLFGAYLLYAPLLLVGQVVQADGWRGLGSSAQASAPGLPQLRV